MQSSHSSDSSPMPPTTLQSGELLSWLPLCEPLALLCSLHHSTAGSGLQRS